MAKYPNSGLISDNEYKKSESHPDLKGFIKMDVTTLRELAKDAEDGEVMIRLSGWHRQGSRGQFISLAWDNYKPKPKQDDGYQQRSAPTQQPKQQSYEEEDDIPF